MFHYEYPEFNNKQLLKAGMLEQLRDYPRYMTQLLFQGYSNGIVNGCELSWNDDQLMINSGVIHWNGHLYFLEKPHTLECRPENQLRYLVVKFLKETKHLDKVTGGTCIYLRKEPVCKQDEMELCRFRLQEGSRLRSVYKDFRDYSTEYDTINIIYSQFVSAGDCNISPTLLMCFAKEMMETELENFFDSSFAINVLANSGRVSRKAVEHYLKKRNGQELKSIDNRELYQGLLKLLENQKSHSSKGQAQGSMKKRIVLI